MRDPKRIPRILEKLRVAWETVPDQRLFQALYNIVGLGSVDAFHVEDEGVERALNAWLEEYTKEQDQ
jgi:hypothetical protein